MNGQNKDYEKTRTELYFLRSLLTSNKQKIELEEKKKKKPAKHPIFKLYKKIKNQYQSQ